MDSLPSLSSRSSWSSTDSWTAEELADLPDDLAIKEWHQTAIGTYSKVRKARVKPQDFVELCHSRLAQWMQSAPPSARIMNVEGTMLVHCIEYNGMVVHIVEGQCRALELLFIVMKAVL